MLVSVLCFAGCGKDDDKLVVYTEAGFAPYEFIYNGEIVGVDIAIMKAVADELGKELVVTDVAFDTIVTSVQNGEAKGVEAQKCNSGYNNVTFPDASKVTVTNTATATGYADPTVPPTGDMTAVYVAVALVSLAAVTVVVKKKITE